MFVGIASKSGPRFWVAAGRGVLVFEDLLFGVGFTGVPSSKLPFFRSSVSGMPTAPSLLKPKKVPGRILGRQDAGLASQGGPVGGASG